MDNNPNMWHVVDPFPRKKIEDIDSYSDRVLAFYSRNKNGLGDFHTEVYGVIEVIKGLEYHFKNIEKLMKKINNLSAKMFSTSEKSKQKQVAKSKSIVFDSCKHEVTAYLNRIYQFSNCYNSNWSKPHIHGCKRSALDNALLFRNNWAKARQIDAKNLKEDDRAQALYSGFYLGGIIGKPLQIQIQITVNKKGTITFSVEREHREVMLEVNDIFFAIFNGLLKM